MRIPERNALDSWAIGKENNAPSMLLPVKPVLDVPSYPAMPVSPCVHILLVEDSEDDAFFFRWALKKLGLRCEVVHVVDGTAAVRHLDAVHGGGETRPDVVFLDLKLPKFSGFDVLQWIRQHPFAPKLNVIMLSGSEHSNDLQRAAELGAAGYCVKPISVEQLRERLAPRHAVTPVSSEIARLDCPA